MKKTIKILFGIAGGLAIVAGILLLFLCPRPGGIEGSRIEDNRIENGQAENDLTESDSTENDSTESDSTESDLTENDSTENDLIENDSAESDRTENSQKETADAGGQNDNEPETGESEIEDSEPFSMVFMGDTYYNNQRVSNYEQNGASGLVDDFLLEKISGAQLAVLNNECALTDGGTAMQDKQYTYRMKPELTQSYVDMGIDLVTLANNHALDFGTEALTDTFRTLERYGIDYIGAGEDLAEARKPAVYEIGGKTVAILSASRVIPVVEWNVVNRQPGMFCTYDSTALEEEIRKSRELYDYVLVYVHWGVMETEQPQDYQRQMAYRFVDAGADVVIGTHPHVVQSVEFYQGKPIYYSLGNFLYLSNISRTMLLSLEVAEDGKLSTKIYPCDAEYGKTKLMTEEKGEEFYRYMESISYSVEIDNNGYVKELEHGGAE